MIKALTLSLALAGMLSPVWAQDADAGQKKAAMCIGCHGIPGYQASFPELHKVPKIAGQNAKYIASALTAYQKGERKHPTMKGIAVTLTDVDIADLSAYYEKLGGEPKAVQAKEAPADVKALLEKGACASCHGADFNKALDASYPKLAGQYSDYLYVALKSYKTEGANVIGRGNAIMGAQVKQFSLNELKALSKYLGSLDGDVKTVAQSRFR